MYGIEFTQQNATTCIKAPRSTQSRVLACSRHPQRSMISRSSCRTPGASARRRRRTSSVPDHAAAGARLARGDGQACAELDEHADAVAARPAADGVAAIVVEKRGPEHVDMRPRPLAGEALEEGPGGDAEVGDPRVEQAVVARVQGPRPGKVAAALPASTTAARQASSLANTPP